MAAESTEPKSGLILQIAFGAVVLLIGIRFGLVSYFNVQMDEEFQRKVVSKTSQQLVDLRAMEQKALTGGPLPIDRAIALVASKPREELGETIAPKPSEDLAPLVGWGQNPKPAPVPPVAAAHDSLATTDGGAADAGASDAAARPAADAAATSITPKAMPADAGAPKNKP